MQCDLKTIKGRRRTKHEEQIGIFQRNEEEKNTFFSKYEKENNEKINQY